MAPLDTSLKCPGVLPSPGISALGLDGVSGLDEGPGTAKGGLGVEDGRPSSGVDTGGGVSNNVRGMETRIGVRDVSDPICLRAAQTPNVKNSRGLGSLNLPLSPSVRALLHAFHRVFLGVVGFSSSRLNLARRLFNLFWFPLSPHHFEFSV